MQKAIDTARILSDSPGSNHLQHLKDVDLFSVFKDIYKLKDINTHDANLLCAYLIYAYDPDSLRLNISKDRHENKEEIMLSLEIDPKIQLMQDIIHNDNNNFNTCVSLYLGKLTDWRWPTIYAQLDYHANMLRFANQKTDSEKTFDKMNKEGVVKEMKQDIDMDTVAKVNIQKGALLTKAIEARQEADRLLEAMRKDFLPTDTATQADFGFQFTETAKKKLDIYSWRDFIKNRNEKKQAV